MKIEDRYNTIPQKHFLFIQGSPITQVALNRWYKNDSFPELMDKEQVVQYEPVFDMVFKTYAPQKSWSLSTLTHGEYSWKHAREGYDELDSCEVEMKTEDIMVDANRIRERRAVLRQLNLYSA